MLITFFEIFTISHVNRRNLYNDIMINESHLSVSYLNGIAKIICSSRVWIINLHAKYTI